MNASISTIITLEQWAKLNERNKTAYATLMNSEYIIGAMPIHIGIFEGKNIVAKTVTEHATLDEFVTSLTSRIIISDAWQVKDKWIIRAYSVEETHET